MLTQELQVIPGLGQWWNLAERRRPTLDCRTDQELCGLYLGSHIVFNTDVSITAERFFEPQVRRRDFLLHGLHQAQEQRIALEITCYQPLRINHDGNRHESDGNNAGDKRFERKRPRAQLHLKVVCFLAGWNGVGAAVIVAESSSNNCFPCKVRSLYGNQWYTKLP